MIPVFQLEKDAGLEQAILGSQSLAFVTEIQKNEVVDKVEIALADVPVETIQGVDNGLFVINSILASVGWNGNDDVFSKEETWAARQTPVNKPFNFRHNEKEIIGHTISSAAFDVKGAKIVKDEDLPDDFNIVNADVIYTTWRDKEYQKKIETTIAEIKDGKWFVSMEAWLNGFDYALVAPDGKNHILARTEETAFLTKHLRAYGGTGKYQDYRVGRLMRNLAFAAKGLVEEPANKRSIIFAELKSFTQANLLKQFPQETIVIATQGEELMSAELEKKISGLEVDLNKSHETIKTHETSIASLKGDKEKLEAAVAEEKKKVSDLEATIAKLTEEKAANEKKLSEVTTAQLGLQKLYDEVNANLKGLQVEAIISSRVTQLSEFTKVEDDEKKKLGDMSEETFAMLLSVAKKGKEAAQASQGQVVPTQAELDAAKVKEEAALAAQNPTGEETRAKLSEFLMNKGFAPKISSK